MTNVSRLVEVPGVGVQVLTTPGNEDRAAVIGRRAADAHAYLSAVIGFEPTVRIAAPGPQHWLDVTDFPVYGFPHFVGEDMLVVGSEPSRFFDGMAALARPQLSDTDRDAMDRVYGRPPAMDRFSDLLVIHELGHLFHTQSGHWFPQRWLAELFANLAMEAWVREREPQTLDILHTLPRCFATIDTSSFAMTAIDAMAESLEAGPEGPTIYAWYQCIEEIAAVRIIDEAGPEVLRRLNDRFRDGTPIEDLREALVSDVHPVFGEFMDHWPTWP